MKIGLLCGMASSIPKYPTIDIWVGVDKGALVLIENNIVPVCAIGDFDSISQQQLSLVKQKIPTIIQLDRHKDLTDTEAAINYCLNDLSKKYDFKEIEIYGATGGRLDHFLANVNILSNLEAQKRHMSLSIIDNQNKIMILTEGQYKIKKENYDYLSFIARNEGVILTLNNVKYPLSRQRLNLTSSLTISNQWTNVPADIVVENGQVIMIKSKEGGWEKTSL